MAGIVTDLIKRGVVAEVPRGQRPAGTPGRPAQVLTLTGPPPAIAALTWSAGMLRVAIATLAAGCWPSTRQLPSRVWPSQP